MLLWKRDIYLNIQKTEKFTPALFWQDVNDFLTKGKGYCITCDNDIANAASERMAEKLGFVKVSECAVIKKYQRRGYGKQAVLPGRRKQGFRWLNVLHQVWNLRTVRALDRNSIFLIT